MLRLQRPRMIWDALALIAMTAAPPASVATGVQIGGGIPDALAHIPWLTPGWKI